MIFFDAHMECVDGWLEPLVARIANDRSVVAVPYIDRIDKYDMSYVYPHSIYVNNLRWSLFFNWCVEVAFLFENKITLLHFLSHSYCTGNPFQSENGNE